MKGYIKEVCERVSADLQEYGMAFVALILYAVVVNLVFHAFCPLIIFCGIPCPGCGISRAALCFLTGRWQQAWQLNPMIFPIILTAVYFGWGRYLMGRQVKGMKTIIAVIFALMIVVYGVRMYLYYPDRVPYIYTEDNILAHLTSLYRQVIQMWGA